MKQTGRREEDGVLDYALTARPLGWWEKATRCETRLR
jgi:hypothetical protein